MGLPLERAQLDGLVVFLVVAELRGFRAAARHLGITASAVSQSIAALEQRVGAPLLSRTTRSVGLTEAGERLLTHARPAIDLLSSGLEAASGLGGSISGRLRVNVPRPMLPLLVNRLLPQFCDTYPDVQLELLGEDRLVDIVAEGFDAGIRVGEFVEPDMVAVRLTPPIRYAVIGAASFLHEHGVPTQPEDLQRFRCIQLRRSPVATYDWEFMVEGQRVKVAVNGPLIVNDVQTFLHAAVRGVGLAHLPVSLAMSYLRTGQALSVLDAFAIEAPSLMLYYPSRTQSLPKLRAFTDFAREHLPRNFSADDFVIG